MNVMEPLMIIIPALLAACIATGLFVYGAIQLLFGSRAPRRLPGYHQPHAHHALARAVANPLLRPRDHAWEVEGVFNPGAARHDGITHLFYRAIGNDGVSRIGHAVARDGHEIDERSAYPVFGLINEAAEDLRAPREARHPGLVASGGSWSGTEDPRAVIIDDRLYLSFSAFNGWDSVRIGVSSIGLRDLERRHWRWSRPVYLSAPDQVHKNWVLFPEKIGGKYAVLHSLYGEGGARDRVLVDYLDTLAEEPRIYIQSPYQRTTDRGVWDSTLRGSGPPPVRTTEGWLVFYHATDAREPHAYKLGAVLLDLEDPSRVIARAKAPVLAPEASYENEGIKPGVVYACGATVENDRLTVYYGAADNVVCAAAASLSSFVRSLLDDTRPTLRPALI